MFAFGQGFASRKSQSFAISGHAVARFDLMLAKKGKMQEDELTDLLDKCEGTLAEVRRDFPEEMDASPDGHQLKMNQTVLLYMFQTTLLDPLTQYTWDCLDHIRDSIEGSSWSDPVQALQNDLWCYTLDDYIDRIGQYMGRHDMLELIFRAAGVRKWFRQSS